MSATKSLLMAAVPRRLKMPLRYWYRMAARRLDPELILVRKLVSRGDVCLDIGANHGLYAYALTRQGAIVHAFEPQPSCARIIRAYRSPQITVHEVALSDHAGQQVLYIPIKSGRLDSGEAALEERAGSFERLEVQLETLDSRSLGSVSFLKIDVEGHELQVIRGGVRTIEHCRPLIVCEIEQRHLNFPMDDVFRELLDRRYKGFYLWHGTLRPLSEFDPTVHQVPANRIGRPDNYVNNFVFVHLADPRHAALSALARRSASPAA